MPYIGIPSCLNPCGALVVFRSFIRNEHDTITVAIHGTCQTKLATMHLQPLQHHLKGLVKGMEPSRDHPSTHQNLGISKSLSIFPHLRLWEWIGARYMIIFGFQRLY